MDSQTAPHRLDVKTLALAGQTIAGQDLLSKYVRLSEDLQGQAPDFAVNWQATGEIRVGANGQNDTWLHLSLNTALPLQCQRCLGPVSVPVQVERAFRFVASEEAAATQDDDSEEDLLVDSREFNLAELIEDELVMAVPLIPRHDVCPTPVRLASADADFDAATPAKSNPFAVLAGLRDADSATPSKAAKRDGPSGNNN